MDKRFNKLPVTAQLALRRKAVEDVLANPQWTPVEAIHHLRTTLRLTIPEFARLAGVSHRTLQQLELGQSTGTAQTLNQLLGVLGMRLGVVKANRSDSPATEQTGEATQSAG